MRLKKKYKRILMVLELLIELALLIIIPFNLRGKIDGLLIIYIIVATRFLHNIK